MVEIDSLIRANRTLIKTLKDKLNKKYVNEFSKEDEEDEVKEDTYDVIYELEATVSENIDLQQETIEKNVLDKAIGDAEYIYIYELGLWYRLMKCIDNIELKMKESNGDIILEILDYLSILIEKYNKYKCL